MFKKTNALLIIAGALGVAQYVLNLIGEEKERKNDEEEQKELIRTIVKEELGK